MRGSGGQRRLQETADSTKTPVHHQWARQSSHFPLSACEGGRTLPHKYTPFTLALHWGGGVVEFPGGSEGFHRHQVAVAERFEETKAVTSALLDTRRDIPRI